MRRSNPASLLMINGAVIFFLFAAHLASADDPRPAPQLKHRPPDSQSFTLKATTRLVVLDVVVTDKKGKKAITDLKPGDFTILEDGNEQKISVFQLQQPPALPANASPPTPLPQNVFSNASQLPPAGPRNVILLDVWKAGWVSQSYGRQQIIKFVEKMPFNEPVAIFVFSQGRIRMLQDFTTDRALLLQAAKNLKPELSLVQHGGYYYDRQVAQAVSQAYSDFAATLSAYPGRKNLIWISDGYASSFVPRFNDSTLVLSAFDFSQDLNPGTQKPVNALVDSQIAVYPVDARGLVAPPMFSAACPSSTFSAFRSTGGFSREPFFDPFSHRDSECGAPSFGQTSRFSAAHQQMDDLAKRTGGKAYYNRNDIAGMIGESIRDGSTYYVLGYYPENRRWNGAFRVVQVKVNRKDLKLRHRQGYFALDPERYGSKPPALQIADLQRALDLNTPTENMVVFQASVQPPSPAKQSKVVIQYAIDPHTITYQPGDDGRQYATVDCVTQAFTEKGEIALGQGNTMSASMKPETFKQVMQTSFPCSQELDLPAGNYMLKLAVRDDRTGAIGTVNAKVTVPKLPANTPAVGRP